MANKLFISTVEKECGKSLISLGVMELLLRNLSKVGFFRPIISGHNKKQDKHINLILSHFGINYLEHDECYAFTADEVIRMASSGQYDQIMEGIYEKFSALEKKCDFVLCESSSYEGITESFDLDLNIEIARTLAAPVLLLGSGLGKDVAGVRDIVKMTVDAYLAKDCKLVSVIINKGRQEDLEKLLTLLRKDMGKESIPIYVIPESEDLSAPTMREIADHLGGQVLYGEESLSNQVHKYSIAAMHLHNYLDFVTDKCLVITPGDRGDIIVGSLIANQSANYPSISGIVVSCGRRMEENIKKLIEGLPNPIPIISSEYNTFITSSKLESLRSTFSYDNTAKIKAGFKNFETYVNSEQLKNAIVKVASAGVSPKMFKYNLLQKAKSAHKHIVLPEGDDDRILQAAAELLRTGAVRLTILGIESEVKESATRLGIDLDKASIVSPALSNKFEEYANKMFELRKHKGVTMDTVRDALVDVSYFGTMMVLTGDADGMVSGAAHTTQHTIRPALQLIKTVPGCSVVSSVFLMCLEDRVVVYGDCAVNPNPTAKELAEIAISSADTAAKFGITPRVAMLSYSSGDSGKGEDVEKVRTATKIVRESRPDIDVEGPIQYDAAVDKGVAAKKMPNSKVAGQATVLIFPDLNTGNNTYKAVQRETGALAIGPVLQGLNRPVNDLSRGCTVDDVVNTIVITAIQGAQS